MARKPRFRLPETPQHVIQRGNNREPCFFCDADKERYLDILEEMSAKNDAAIHAYVLMSNHVHLLITPGHEFSIMHTMQDLGRKYVAYINRVHKRSGTLWEGRYKASLVDSESYLLTCMIYIEMNPVRAGIVSNPGSYHWSSYAFNGDGRPDRLLTPHPNYESLGRSAEECRAAYRRIFRNRIDDDEIRAIREALQQELVVGRDAFKDKVARMLNRQTREGKTGRPRKGLEK